MNTTTKAVVASVVVIALCLCAVGGVTYSWFSDTEKTDIEITAGTIDLEMSVGDVYVQSYGGLQKPIDISSGSGTGTSDIGGTVTISANPTDSTTVLSISFQNMAPGDTIGFSIGGTLANTIKVRYTETYNVAHNLPAGITDVPIIVTGLNDSSVEYDAVATGSPTTIASKPVTVKMDEDAGNEYQNTSFQISIIFEAMQYNAPAASAAVVNVTEGLNTVTLNSVTDGVESMTISFTATAGQAGTYTFTPLTESQLGYAVAAGETFIAGLDVTSASGGSALSGTDVTVTTLMTGQYSGTDLIVYHGDQNVTGTVNLSASYDATTGITTVTFVTNAGFSPYYITTSTEASVGEDLYSSIESAIASAVSGATVVLLNDVTVDQAIEVPSGKSLTLDLNGHSLTSSAAMFSVAGSLTVVGEGMVDSGDVSPFTVAGGSVQVLGGTYTADPKDYLGASVLAETDRDGNHVVYSVSDLNTVARLQAFAASVNNGNSYQGITAGLSASINLSGIDWTPIGTATARFSGTFDGNGFTVSNLTVSMAGSDYAGLFGAASGASITDLTVSGASVTGRDHVGVVVGCAFTSSLSDLHVVGTADSKVTVVGGHWVGGITGYTYGDISNCSVDHITITCTPYIPDSKTEYDNGDKVGGIVGFVSNSAVTSCSVSNADITAYRDVGGVVGSIQFENSYPSVSGCSVSNTMVTADQRVNPYGAKDTNAGEVYGRNVNITNPDVSNNTVDSDTVKVIEIGADDIVIDSPQDLMDLASTVNGGNFTSGTRVVLMADLDMTGYAWVPIAQSISGYPANSFNGTFEGYWHTISNLKSADSRATNADTYAADGLIGALLGTVQNVTVDNATITGTHYVGGIAGYSSANTSTNIINCHVTNSTLTSAPVMIGAGYDNGDKAGGIIGYCVAGDRVEGCTVSGTTVTAYRDVGGLVGCADYGSVLTGNSVTDVTVIQDGTNGYKDSVTTVDDIVGRKNGSEADSKWSDNTATGVTISFRSASAETVQSALDSGNDIKLEEDLDVSATLTGYAGVAGIVQTNGGTIDGGGKTLTVSNANGTYDGAVATTGGTIQNMTVTGSFRGIMADNLTEDLYVNNVIVDGTTYTIHSHGGNGSVSMYITECTLNGWTSFGGNFVTVDFTDCSFGKSNGYAYLRPYSPCNLDGCTFIEGFQIDSTKVPNQIVMKDCYVGTTLVTADNLTTLLGEDALNIVIQNTAA